MNRYQSDHKVRKYFVGMADRELAMGMACRDAFANASKNITNGIKTRSTTSTVQAQTQDTSIRDYNVSVERAVEDGPSRWRSALSPEPVSIDTAGRNWVQAEAGAPVRYYYNVYALVSMSLDHDNQTLYQTLNDPRAHHVIKKYGKDVAR
ncbi:MAG: hypothetical protein ACYCOU_15840 [Sulfobacillus sp.]